MTMSAHGFSLERTRDTTDYYCDNSVQVDHSEEDIVWFVGLAQDSRLEVTYFGVNVFAVAAEELFHLIASHEPGQHSYRPEEYFFPVQRIGLWNADQQYDRLGDESGPVWAEVSVGNAAYAAAIAEIRAEA
jgi:hypothetical protein